MGRAIAAVVVAEVVWSALWLGGSFAAQSALPDLVVAGQPLTHTGLLLGYVAYSAVLSIGAGYVAAWVKGVRPMRTVWVFAFIQLAVGIGVEVSAWTLTPVWYHLMFLALLVPATVFGGRLRAAAAAPLADGETC
ncbi:MAG TPA: hypothetical protein VGA70_08820 [Longimicrobiales bacterium]